jgi:hypothetical protein
MVQTATHSLIAIFLILMKKGLGAATIATIGGGLKGEVGPLMQTEAYHACLSRVIRRHQEGPMCHRLNKREMLP